MEKINTHESSLARNIRLSHDAYRASILTISCLLLVLFSCTNSKPVSPKDSKSETVTTVGYFDTLEAKSGFNINGYWVSLTPEQLQKYKGKKVEVKGKLLTVPGVDENAEIKTQGASSDQYFITDPQIKIVE